MHSDRTPREKFTTVPSVIRVRSFALAGLALIGPALTLPAATAAAQPDAAAHLPPDPAPAPPAPARLGDPAPAAPAPQHPAIRAHLPGLETLPDGAWRLRFPDEQEALPPPAGGALARLAERLAGQEQGRFTLYAQASGPAADASAARRLSLARGLAVKQALVAGGLPATRIDIRPMGRTEEAVDAVDILPPEVQRPAR